MLKDGLLQEYRNFIQWRIDCTELNLSDEEMDKGFNFSNEWHDRLDHVVQKIAEKNNRNYNEFYEWDIGGGVVNINFKDPANARIMEFAVSALYNEEIFQSYLA